MQMEMDAEARGKRQEAATVGQYGWQVSVVCGSVNEVPFIVYSLRQPRWMVVQCWLTMRESQRGAGSGIAPAHTHAPAGHQG